MKSSGTKSAASAITPFTPEGMRALGEKSANNFLDDVQGCANPSFAFADWRADCYAELVDNTRGTSTSQVCSWYGGGLLIPSSRSA